MGDHSNEVNVKRHRHAPDHDEAHGEESEAWLISYADMMTLLMAFFAIMFSFSTVDQKKFDEIRKEVSKEFGGKYELPFEELQKQLEEIIKREGLTQQVAITRTGKDISLVFMGTMLFEQGSVSLRQEESAALGKIIDAVAATAKTNPIYVEGHTDNAPISTAQFPSNWELSAARATAIIRMLEAKGLDKKNLNAQGFADSRPLVPNVDAAGASLPDNQQKNRRVVIRVAKQYEF
ncbi:MAG: OmpA family protein [Methylotenera sp.]|nr:OmpA family protein [Oligoflexia bacterium]